MTEVYRNSSEEWKVCRQAVEKDSKSHSFFIVRFPGGFPGTLFPRLLCPSTAPRWCCGEGVSGDWSALLPLATVHAAALSLELQLSGGGVTFSMVLSFIQVRHPFPRPFKAFAANLCCRFQSDNVVLSSLHICSYMISF